MLLPLPLQLISHVPPLLLLLPLQFISHMPSLLLLLCADAAAGRTAAMLGIKTLIELQPAEHQDRQHRAPYPPKFTFRGTHAGQEEK